MNCKMRFNVIGLRCYNCKADFGSMRLEESDSYTAEQITNIFNRLSHLGLKPICNECLKSFPFISKDEMEQLK